MSSSTETPDLFALYNGDMSAMAYVKPLDTDRGKYYAVFSAEGTELARFNNRDAAFFAAIQHDLEPVTVH